MTTFKTHNISKDFQFKKRILRIVLYYPVYTNLSGTDPKLTLDIKLNKFFIILHLILFGIMCYTQKKVTYKLKT